MNGAFASLTVLLEQGAASAQAVTLRHAGFYFTFVFKLVFKLISNLIFNPARHDLPETMTLPPPSTHAVAIHHAHSAAGSPGHPARSSVLSWPAWKRIVAVLPLCLLLWLGVAWALAPNLA